MTINVLGIAARVVLWTIVLLLILDNLGINVTALVTGLDIGGIAIALAVQNILGDLFAALSIVLDKPFVVGDAINVGDAAGSVEHIGLKSTRLRSDTGGDDHDLERRSAQEPNPELSRPGEAARHSQARDRVRHAGGEAGARARDHSRGGQKERGVKFDRSNFTSFGMFALGTESVYSVYS